VTLAEYRGTAALLAAFVATMRLAVAFAAPFKDGGAAGVRGPERRRQLGKAVQNAPTNV
jgi:hypothetical protein